MVGADLSLAVLYVFSDVLYDHGFVHGVSRKNARLFLYGVAMFVVIVWIGILMYWAAEALPLAS